MRIAHLLRKYNPSEWGGTETAVKRLFDGLRHHDVESIAYCPQIPSQIERDPFTESGYRVERFSAFVPVARISAEQKQQLISVGGNLMSFDLIWRLLREKNLSLIHTHTHNRLGGIGLTVARARRIPLVVTLHGGVLDLPSTAKRLLQKPLEGGLEWGKIFGLPLRSRKVLQEADAIVTCNRTEADLLRNKYPKKIILAQPHGVPVDIYSRDCRVKAREAFPQIVGKKLLLSVGRIDSVKNQGWLIEQAHTLFLKNPDAVLILVGSCTEPAYGKSIERDIQKRNLESRVFLTGGLPPGDARLIGLFQEAKVLLLPSLYETFGLVILEAWAAGTPVISSRTTGASELVKDGENGWLFDLKNPDSFHSAISVALANSTVTTQMGTTGNWLVKTKYDTNVLAANVKNLYETLIGEKR